jgi:DnaJ-class molecular chaperone
MRTAKMSARCPRCGGELTLRRVDDPFVLEYRALCHGCGLTGPLRELRCGGCHGNRLFTWTGNAWRCLDCGHIRDGRSPPRSLERVG